MAAVSAAWRCRSCGADNPQGTRFCGQCGGPAAPLAQAAPTPDINAALRNFVDHQVADRLAGAGGRLTEERRLVTALFADISGFTPLADRLDPEQLLEVIDPIISRLSSIVGHYEGYVDKFAGDALLAFFGAPVSHEDDAVRALLVALDMHREMQSLLEQLQPDVRDLSLHIGVNTGHVVARVLGSDARLDYSVLGDAVILAQRLESVAPGGATYVGEATYRLTAHRFDLLPVGDLTLKGKAQPVPAWRLDAEASHAAPLPARPGRTWQLVGREAEIRSCEKALETLRGGTGGMLAIVGEAGIGKSRLAQAIHQQATAMGIRWLECRCLSYGAGLAYWPYADLLRRLFNISRNMGPKESLEQLRSSLNAHGLNEDIPFVARLIGLPSADGHGLEPEALQRRINAAVANLFKTLAQETPTVLCLEDLHWIDSASSAMTTEVARICDGQSSFLFLLTGRPEARTRIEEIMEPVADRPPVELELAPLEQANVGRFVASMLQSTADTHLLASLMERTAGNPFFVEELVRSLLQTGDLVERAGRLTLAPSWSAKAVPQTVEGVIAARIDRLPHAERTALQIGAVIGRRVRRPLLKAVAADVTDVDLAVQSLIEGGFLDREPDQDSVVFHHALTQEVAYGQLLRKRRRELHQRIGETTEALYGGGDDVIDLLARHFYLGDGGLKALEHCVRAAQRAMRLFANAEAITLFSHAADVARRHAELASRLPAILLNLAKLHERAGSYTEALAAYSEVRTLTEDLEAARGSAGILRKQGRYQEALALLAEAEEARADDGRDLRQLWLERGWTLSVSGNIEKATDVFRAALGTRRRDDTIEARLLLELSRVEAVGGRLDDALEHALSAQRIFEEQEDLPGLTTVLRIVGHIQEKRGRFDEASEVLRRGLALARRVGNSEEIGGCLINLGVVELRRGAISAAIACDREAVEEFERTGHAHGRAAAYGNLADKLAHAGQYEEALRYCQRAAEVATAIGHPITVADVQSTMAVIHLGKGEFAEAAAQAQTSADRFIELGALTYAATALGLAADALEKSGKPKRAVELRRRAASLGSQPAAL